MLTVSPRFFALLFMVLTAAAPALGAPPATRPTTRPDAARPANAHEQLAEDMIRFVADVTATLKTVVDEKSAKAAVPQFDAYEKRVRAMKAASEQAGPPAPAVRQAVAEKYGVRLTQSLAGFGAERERIQGDPALAAVMAEPMGRLEVFGHAVSRPAN